MFQNMLQSYRVVSWAVAVGVAVTLIGCSSKAPPEKQKAPTTTEKSAQTKPDDQTAPASVPEGLAQLSAEDRAAAEKQRVCPVSGDLLGAMDKPYKVTAKGQTVFLCCQGCEAQFLKDPDKYLAKLKGGKPK